ncbi:hypothetical protein AA0312_1782 [Acetobacter tropicalis NRIC 0312]|uniref:Transposase n=1 Tax=Acetobacter tropicalis TaxID=104102 RepID=A0A511FS22_9PROT|nr:hypothetical protein [Acetobacter tropicalis]GBR26122.1 hypothetical protein AA0488_0826 [Kozakia baliensis NRIC 0488]GBR70308.1 hypothetical protein AA0312_1782 [Acetobacter tropicalis NRIC 0312]GEL65790.1 hypothetical protein KBA01_30760 [Kozakia baliensis]GAL96875.1 hypothetical protein ATR1_050c0003 [Acetobacter tropicalis]GEL51704.1 hypothetical protein ATR01nite_27790 [Acetobacter tropicalis]
MRALKKGQAKPWQQEKGIMGEVHLIERQLEFTHSETLRNQTRFNRCLTLQQCQRALCWMVTFSAGHAAITDVTG